MNYIIKVTSVLSKKTKTFDTVKEASDSTGISRYFFGRIREGKASQYVRGKNEILFLIEFIDKEIVVTLTPAWDTADDEEAIQAKSFHSHLAAIHFLSEGGPFMCKRSTYYRRMSMQELGVPCSQPILDYFNRPWIVVYYSKGEYIPNKKLGETDEE